MMYASLHIVIIYFEIRDLSLSIFGFNHTQKPHSPSQHKNTKNTVVMYGKNVTVNSDSTQMKYMNSYDSSGRHSQLPVTQSQGKMMCR